MIMPGCWVKEGWNWSVHFSSWYVATINGPWPWPRPWSFIFLLWMSKIHTPWPWPWPSHAMAKINFFRDECIICGACSEMLGDSDSGLGFVVHFPLGYVAKINTPWTWPWTSECLLCYNKWSSPLLFDKLLIILNHQELGTNHEAFMRRPKIRENLDYW